MGRRFEAYGWQVQHVEDGNDLEALEEAMVGAAEDTHRPSLVVVRTHIGFGAPKKQDTAATHGAPSVRRRSGRGGTSSAGPTQEFFIPELALGRFREAVVRGAELESSWRTLFGEWAASEPKLAPEWHRAMEGRLPPDWESYLPDLQGETRMSTRKASGKVLAAVAPRLPELVGGSADLTDSNSTALPDERPFSAGRSRTVSVCQ